MKFNFKRFLTKLISCLINILIVLTIFLIIINLFLIFKKDDQIVPSIFGYKFLIELSDSMNDVIEVGDLIIVKEVDVSELEKGDVITYHSSENIVVTHRIVELVDDEDGLCFKTKGDNNNVVDLDLVCHTELEGKYLFRLKGLGNFFLFLRSTVGIIVLLLVIIAIMIAQYLIDKIFSIEE